MSAPAVEVRRGEAALALLDGAWDDLVLRQPLPNPTLRADWLRRVPALLGGEPLVAVARRDGRAVAGAALRLRPYARRGGPRVAEWLGGGRPVITPDALAMPGEPGAADAVMAALLDDAGALVLGPTPDAGPALAALRARAPWLRERADAVGGWVLPLPAAGIERRRRQMAYEVRRAEREGARVEVSVARAPGEVGDALERLIDLHARRWAGRADDLSRVSATAAERHWHRGAVAAVAAGGGAAVTEVREDGVVVGAALMLRMGAGAMLHTLAAIEGPRLRGPGNLAVLAVVEEAAAASCRALDMGRGGGAHKTRFRPEAASYARVEVARGRAAQRALALAQDLRRRLR